MDTSPPFPTPPASSALPPMARIASPEQLDQVGRRAAELVTSGNRVGLGSGRAALAFVRALGQRVRHEHLSIVGLPTSLLTEKVARESGIPVQNLEEVEALDIAIDGADEVDPQMNLIKGGGGNLTREKVIESIARRLVIVVGQEKVVDQLGTNFPVFVEVIEFARPAVVRALKAMGGEVTQRRMPDGTPFLTDNHNPYLHVRFGPPPHHLADPAAIEKKLRTLPGVVETGLFIGMAHEVLIARFDGTIEHRR